MEGQRNFIEVDDHSALDVGVLKKGPIQSIVKGLCERSRKGIMEGFEKLF